MGMLYVAIGDCKNIYISRKETLMWAKWHWMVFFFEWKLEIRHTGQESCQKSGFVVVTCGRHKSGDLRVPK